GVLGAEREVLAWDAVDAQQPGPFVAPPGVAYRADPQLIEEQLAVSLETIERAPAKAATQYHVIRTSSFVFDCAVEDNRIQVGEVEAGAASERVRAEDHRLGHR